MTDIGVAVVAAVVLVLACVAAWLALRRIRRVVALWQQRLLTVRIQWMAPGPRRDAIMLRRLLARELLYTQTMLAAAPDGMIFRADSEAVLRELTEIAAGLDSDIRAIECFSDPRQQQAALAVVAPQVQQLIDTSYSARQTIVRTSAEDRDRRLTRVHSHVAQQEAAASVYRQGDRDLTI